MHTPPCPPEGARRIIILSFLRRGRAGSRAASRGGEVKCGYIVRGGDILKIKIVIYKIPSKYTISTQSGYISSNFCLPV